MWLLEEQALQQLLGIWSLQVVGIVLVVTMEEMDTVVGEAMAVDVEAVEEQMEEMENTEVQAAMWNWMKSQLLDFSLCKYILIFLRKLSFQAW